VENWKYTNLRALEQGEYHRVAPKTVGKIDGDLAQWRNQYAIANLNTIELVFIDGHFSETLSSNVSGLPSGVELVRFSDANAQQQADIVAALDTIAIPEKHLFSALNAAILDDGVYLRVGKNVKLKSTLHIVNVGTITDSTYASNQRLLVVMEAGSEATVVEHFAPGAEGQRSFTNSITELQLEANAILHHYRLQLEAESAIHIGGVHVNLERDARLNGFYLGLGGEIKRVDVVVNYQGEGAHCDLNGVYLSRNNQHIDYHTCIEHAVPRCTSNEVFRGIISDSARAVFNGRIHIHRDAQKTLAQLSNKNLLTSNKAEVDTKPELEIYADDVQCAHGATVAQLDDEAMHYLQTRGVSEEEARTLLSYGFVNELINGVEHKAIADALRPILTSLFARDTAFVDQIR